MPVGGFEVEILELMPSARIVWCWGSAGTDKDNGPVYGSSQAPRYDPRSPSPRCWQMHGALTDQRAAIAEGDMSRPLTHRRPRPRFR
jgi:hypothetical protein